MTKHPIPIVELGIELDPEIVSERLLSALFIATGVTLIALIAVITFSYGEPKPSKELVDLQYSTHPQSEIKTPHPNKNDH